MISGTFPTRPRWILGGVAAVTSPAPVRDAALVARYDAPLYCWQPPTNNTFPKVPLCAFIGRLGILGMTNSSVINIVVISSAIVSGIPISATDIDPQCSAAGIV